jgi:Protein of unknown function (DUF1064)
MADRAAWTKFAGVKLEAPKSKYGAKPMVVDGIRFDSTKEAKRYRELRLLEKAGVIRDLELQPRYPIVVRELKDPGGRTLYVPAAWITCGHYTADFRYVDAETAATVVEDVKSTGTKTTAYRLRKRLVEAIHGVKIVEV